MSSSAAPRSSISFVVSRVMAMGPPKGAPATMQEDKSSSSCQRMDSNSLCWRTKRAPSSFQSNSAIEAAEEEKERERAAAHNDLLFELTHYLFSLPKK